MKRILSMFQFIICLALTFFMIAGLGKLTRPASNDGSIGAIRAFHQLPEDSVEVLLYGSSHVWRGLDPAVMYRDHGIGAYNYANNWQHINTTRLFLQDSVKTQSPRLAVIDTYRFDAILEDVDMDGEIYYTRALENDSAKIGYLRQCFGDEVSRYFSYFVPLAAFHENWKQLNEKSFQLNRDLSADYRKTLGMEKLSSAEPAEPVDPEAFEEKEYAPECLAEMDRLVDLCRRNDMDILFITVPYMAEYSYSDAMEEYAEKNGYRYLNFFDVMDEIGLDPAADYNDATHLNADGAAKVSDYLAAYIREHYEVTDFRTMPGNLWENSIEG